VGYNLTTDGVRENWTQDNGSPDAFDEWLTKHDEELAEKVRAATLKLAENIAFGVSGEFDDASNAAADIGNNSEAINQSRNAFGASTVGHNIRTLNRPAERKD
jgi:hypothetical protein